VALSYTGPKAFGEVAKQMTLKIGSGAVRGHFGNGVNLTPPPHPHRHSSSNFPRFDINPNSGEPLNNNRRWQIAENTYTPIPRTLRGSCCR